MRYSVKDLLVTCDAGAMCKSVRKIWNTVPAGVCWVIRKERNARCFEGIIEAIKKIKYTYLWFLGFWCYLEEVKDEKTRLDFIDTLQE